MSTERRVVVTGASAGLGYWAAEQLAAAGHRVVLATRSPERADAAERSIRQHVPDAALEHLHVDLADLDSVRAAADDLGGRGPVDALVNNAGVVGSGTRRSTAQGFELQVGTNHLGHFALTGLVLPLLEQSAGRVVHLGSIAHRWASLDPGDPLRVGRYSSYGQYGRSKLAVMLFGFELAERLADAGSSVSSVVAHPGLSLDALAPSRPLVAPARTEPGWTRPGQRLYAQGKDAGALPIVHAAVGAADGPDAVRSGQYWGPAGFMQLRGPAAVVRAQPRAHDRTEAARLWVASERASGVAFALDALV
ncbi:NADP-dependent 3-hydroxy acid dehydrogenase YdfG [Curtobacterium sp. PhB130]|uniref:SDR family NAD(P)-dependent oxidoreductase n=1 Tax=unclassified Curtobacterium TaxID=257496 RepID=UPI000F4C060F|nr:MULTISPECIES: SDR family NAD(P)-dependent oxidoreductase [unclassified Curtobacterium]ROS73279.1 NADP-dependent 3-hydroxy acid dehydrogenase YdfG [Curtobacterium sp. PhB130]TCK61140.1 NADP-dependent 3-hydroxy acid dehydrogenase YdfG [Curtobacterium sp. PhB136]